MMLNVFACLSFVFFFGFSSLIPKMLMFTLAMSCLIDHIQFTLTRRPNIPGSNAILFLTALYFTFTTRYIHNWVSFLLWLSLFILPGAISPLFSSIILDSYQLEEGVSTSCVTPFCLFMLFMRVLQVRTLEWFDISLSSRPCFVRTLHHDSPSWVALHDMAHSFIECTRLIHVIILVSFLWLWFSFWRLWDCSSCFLMGGNGCGQNWVLFCWAEPCSVNL